jgi:hypothetical protein
MSVSEFQREPRQAPADAGQSSHGATHLHSLNASLLQDLMRFGPEKGHGLELLEVLAAAVRHGRPLKLHLEHGFQVMPMTVFPVLRTVYTPLPTAQFLNLRLPELRVLQVQPENQEAEQTSGHAGSLGWMLWELSLRGSRSALLPEIAGVAAYRVAPSSSFDGMGLTGSMAAAVEKLRQQSSSLREIANFPGFDEDRASRTLNALYLQAALIVSRSTPAATQEI